MPTGDPQFVLRCADEIRKPCAEAHNRQFERLGPSSLGALMRSLPERPSLEAQSPEHLLLSSYTYWGSRKLGDSRRGFEKHFARIASKLQRELFEAMRYSSFGAWRCVEVGDQSRWDSVGATPETTEAVELVFDGSCERVEPKDGRERAGWILEFEGVRALAYSMELDPAAVQRLEETSAERGWHDEKQGFERVHYEKDVLMQAVCPEYEECGLQKYYFIPAGQREWFPGRFRKEMARALMDYFDSHESPWQVNLARAEASWIVGELHSELETLRENAALRAGRFRGGRIDYSILDRIVSDEECLQLLGLTADGDVELESVPPIDTHPVDVLDLSQNWFENTGVSPWTSIRRAKEELQRRGLEDDETFECAVEEHRQRLRWAELMRHTLEDPEISGIYRSGGYEEVRAAARELFDPVITKMPVVEVIADEVRAPSRIVTALESAGLGEAPICVEDLPMDRVELSSTQGIGRVSMEAIVKGLLEVMREWPPGLERRIAEVDDETRSEIDEGLDELEDLFG